ncbi:ATP-binding cassette domain-containing protein [Lutibacter sp.]|uniref:ATP-binding cassette domain-containing protein n=1 Tax=Lutibacter sp. TaxID=1925666 RepID=UPI0035666D4F
MTKKHIALLLKNRIDKKNFTEYILSKKVSGNLHYLNKLKGILFSDIAIENIIHEEYKYDSIKVAFEKNRKLSSFSSGERRKEFLKYCIRQNPDYIIFDSAFDHLDSKSQLELSNEIEHISNQILIVQLTNSFADILSFINQKFEIKNNNFEVEKINHPTLHNTVNFETSLPDGSENMNVESNILVNFNNVEVSYNNKKIVTNINWVVKKNEFWQLIGPNGSGKSTLLSLITGENTKAYGQDITIFGQKKGTGESIWDLKKRIGYFSTTLTELFSRNHTLEQLILSGYFDSIGLYQKPQTHQIYTVNQWLNIIHLTNYKKTPFRKLSLGHQRLALIIRAIVKQPPLLILDEPLEGLDDENITLVTQLINYLVSTTTTTILYVSHRVEPRLSPNLIFELVPNKNGSLGFIKSI